MGRTVPSFRIVLAQEKQEWKPFRNALDKSERKAFDEMWDIPRLYVSACSYSVHLVPLHPIMISILFHHYKEIKEYIFEIEQLEAVSSTVTESSSKKKEKRLTTKEEKEEEEKQEEQKQETLTTLDGYILLQECDVVNIDGDNTLTEARAKVCDVTQTPTATNTTAIANFSENAISVEAILAEIGLPTND